MVRYGNSSGIAMVYHEGAYEVTREAIEVAGILFGDFFGFCAACGFGLSKKRHKFNRKVPFHGSFQQCLASARKDLSNHYKNSIGKNCARKVIKADTNTNYELWYMKYKWKYCNENFLFV